MLWLKQNPGPYLVTLSHPTHPLSVEQVALGCCRQGILLMFVCPRKYYSTLHKVHIS